MIRPVRVAIPHSMFLPESQGHSVCFFCRSDDHDALEGYFRTHPFNGLVKIISITQVRKSYNTYKDRKALLKDHTHFVCDARVMTQLYNLLGKVFAERNNLPVPIEFETFSKIPAALQVLVSFFPNAFFDIYLTALQQHHRNLSTPHICISKEETFPYTLETPS